jgi:competence protein ComEA
VSRWARLLLAAAALLLASPAFAKRPLRPGERIDLNRATAAELMRLPGIGAKRARAIVARRAERPYQAPADVLAVKGLGEAWFRGVKVHLVVTPSSSVHPVRSAPGERAQSRDAGASKPSTSPTPPAAAPVPKRIASR